MGEIPEYGQQWSATDKTRLAYTRALRMATFRSSAPSRWKLPTMPTWNTLWALMFRI